MSSYDLKIIGGNYSIHRFSTDKKIPNDLFDNKFLWYAKTDEEISVVCNSDITLQSDKVERGWKALKLIGPFAFTQVGVIAEISGVLAKAGLGIFVISTFDTDYVLVKSENIQTAVSVLKKNGCNIINDINQF